MRWRGLGQSSNVEDRRGMGGMAVGGGLGAVVIALVALFFGVDPGQLMQTQSGPAPAAEAPAADDTAAAFASAVLKSTEVVWASVLPQQAGVAYTDPTLVLYSGTTSTAGCSYAQAAVGPFYCPADGKVYIDLDFLHQLQARLHAGGDFAEAYIIAHEVGHHVQDLLGVTSRVRGDTEAGAEGGSVRLELQADCFAGVWANHAQEMEHVLEPGDVEEAVNAAAAVGDDALQSRQQGYVVPDSFTHGTSEQRARWFERGFRSGALDQCDTFGAREL